MIRNDAASSCEWPHNYSHIDQLQKKANEDFVVKANTVRMYSRVSIVRDLRDVRSEKQACDVANGLFGQLYQLSRLYDLAQ